MSIPAANAQNWTYHGDFPTDGETLLAPHNHGIAVTPNGNVWIQSYYPFAGDSVMVTPFVESAGGCSATTSNCRVTAIHAFNPEGEELDFSPISIVTLPGGEQDTLGGRKVRNAEGQTRWSWQEGTGVRVDQDGNVFANFGKRIVKIDGETGAILADATPSELLSATNAGMGITGTGDIVMTGTFPGDPLAIYDGTTLAFKENVTAVTRGFNRVTIGVPYDANTVILPNYSSDIATIYSRDNDLVPFDSVGTTFEGMAVESYAFHPTSDHLWVSAGSPNDLPAGTWDDGNGNTGTYQPHTWYDFRWDDVLAGGSPVPVDSITWNNPGDGRPRGIAFSPDGRTAYVGEFNIASPAVQVFQVDENYVGTEDVELANGTELKQNRPNPFSGSTRIAFDLAAAGHVSVRVYDVMGREVATLLDQQMNAGPQSVTFDAKTLAAGTYLYTLDVDGQRLSRRMLLAR